jgi:ACS family pantothenate transporter-like MFS transporter
MTVPVGIATILFLPDTPHTTLAWFLTKDECALGLARVEKAGKAPPVPITWQKLRRIFTRWSMHIYPTILN